MRRIFVTALVCIFGLIVPYIGTTLQIPVMWLLNEALVEDWAGTIARIATGLCFIILLLMLGWRSQAKLTLKIDLRASLLSWLCLIALLSPGVWVFELGPVARPKALVLASDTLAVGILEEVVFRGFAFVWLLRIWEGHRFQLLVAAVFSGLSFGLAHLDPWFLVYGPLFGLIFCQLLIGFRTIIVPIIGHFLFNFLARFPVDADGQEIDHIGNAISAPLLLGCAIAVFIVFARRKAE